jgi:uncharacterized protein YdeI (YjbR/CyaY-like superfamily)
VRPASKPRFFATQAAFREWLEKNHERESELLVGFHKKASGKPSITWAEAVEEALCFGWIDGVRRSIDDESYVNRFTPRRPGSTWSAVNIARAKTLIAAGKMTPAGARAFETGADERSAKSSYQQRHGSSLTEAQKREFRESRSAWAWFQAEPPSYQRAAAYWVLSAKKDETKQRRLARLIDDSAAGRRVPPLARPTDAR